MAIFESFRTDGEWAYGITLRNSSKASFKSCIRLLSRALIFKRTDFPCLDFDFEVPRPELAGVDSGILWYNEITGKYPLTRAANGRDRTMNSKLFDTARPRDKNGIFILIGWEGRVLVFRFGPELLAMGGSHKSLSWTHRPYSN